ncbi:SUN domain-containing protein 1-like [Andrographis paniculata]|uniref:SUN domain-containing protein 1-like n=1 Tax=Andrographis paniculata TaxID=175694 RepID=UPI0021E90E07|nr:SUN domain-containing protein 1-like [Andrographis paniculata]
MSASTVSITANQGPTTRRRAYEKNVSAGGSDLVAAATVTAAENDKDVRVTAADTAAAILREARRAPAQGQGKKSVPGRKSTKPRWLTVVSILTKNIALLVVLVGFVQMIRWVVMYSGREDGDPSIIRGDFDGKLSELKRFVMTTTKAMQVQMDAVDQKIDEGMSSVRKDLDEKLEKMTDSTDLKLKALDARSDMFEKFMDEFRSKSLLTKEEFRDFFEEFKRSETGSDRTDVSLDEIKDFARKIVEKEIEKHAADGLGMVDYALASGGGKVVRHSEPYGAKKVGGLLTRNVISVDAEKLIKPSFGEPGQCFPLKGSSGFVEIRLRAAIVPEAVTLEHVAKSVAYNRSSAPKNCRVSGWLDGQDSSTTESNEREEFVLTEFSYDLEKPSVQTFKVQSGTNVVNTVRFDFRSNHGSGSHTCIYRVRVHGREPQPGEK